MELRTLQSQALSATFRTVQALQSVRGWRHQTALPRPRRTLEWEYWRLRWGYPLFTACHAYQRHAACHTLLTAKRSILYGMGCNVHVWHIAALPSHLRPLWLRRAFCFRTQCACIRVLVATSKLLLCVWVGSAGGCHVHAHQHERSGIVQPHPPLCLPHVRQDLSAVLAAQASSTSTAARLCDAVYGRLVVLKLCMAASCAWRQAVHGGM
jgi:hypothetical protein